MFEKYWSLIIYVPVMIGLSLALWARFTLPPDRCARCDRLSRAVIILLMAYMTALFGGVFWW